MRTATQTVFTFLNKVLLSFLAFINSALAARTLDKGDRVQFQFAGTVTTTGTTFVGGYTGYYAYALPKSPADTERIVHTGTWFVAFACVLVWGGEWLLVRVLGLHLSAAWAWAVACMPLNFVFGFGTRLLQGSDEITWLNRANTVQPLLFLVTYVPLWLHRQLPESARILWTYRLWWLSFAVAALCSVGIAFWRLRRQGRLQNLFPAWRGWSRHHIRGTLDYGSWLSVSYVVNYANLRMDFWWVLGMLPARVASDYGIAVTSSEVLVTIANSVASVVFTRMTGGPRHDAIRITQAAVRQTLLSATAVAAVMCVTFPWLIVTVFGARYQPAVVPFLILLPGLVFRASGLLIIQYATNQLGNPRISIWMNGVSAAMCAAVAAAAVPRLGLAGGAVASTTSYVVSYALYVAWFARHTGTPARDLYTIRAGDLAPYRQMAQRMWRRVTRRKQGAA